ncbi:hypothetical protein M409DRAFT_22149 [Zasmidium cellare ATCC 36951]|uniref:F-box domain-containing protein n=1 Tax=Zasmidium cellare ATCC 36951 TaxID=1080233 RepID=A0A6A6CNM7_ZASCE|nr:uncharacterized protein M409DRAFT_22149 [Zasmidium cellare ATCC 36951]KAF2167339.1 hypothetical protein M409DRAFT_22149 [Zasmidium cellare ATCC 36951]
MSSQRQEVDSAAVTLAALMSDFSLEVQECVANSLINGVHAKKKNHLLGLPAELRNAIYGYALVKQEPVKVYARTTQQPALLQVSRQMRDEASSIYYQDNEFELVVMDYNGAAFAPFYSIIKRREYKVTQAVSSHRPDWKNLVAWMSAAYHDRAWGVEQNVAGGCAYPTMPRDYLAAAAIFTAQFRVMMHLPWAQVETIIQAMRPVLILLDWRWELDD